MGLVEMCKNTNYLSRNLIRGVLCPVFGAFVQLAVYRVVVMVLISRKKENVEPIVLVTVTTYIYLDVPTFASSKSMW